MKIDVEVWCNRCDKPMIGARVMAENLVTQVQAKQFTCECADVTVALVPVHEKGHGNIRPTVQ